jgi:hypothetical protein
MLGVIPVNYVVPRSSFLVWEGASDGFNSRLVGEHLQYVEEARRD